VSNHSAEAKGLYRQKEKKPVEKKPVLPSEMKGLFKSKPRTPAEVVRQTRDLLLYVQRAPDTRESKREEKVRLLLFGSTHIV
jgi:hypothetical protein